MVVMDVREEHRIEVREHLVVRERDDTPEVRDASAQNGVGDQPHTAELEQDRAVAQPREPQTLACRCSQLAVVHGCVFVAEDA